MSAFFADLNHMLFEREHSAQLSRQGMELHSTTEKELP